MGRLQHSVEAVDRIVAEFGPRSAQHVVDLIQAAIRSNAPVSELEELDIMMRIITTEDRSRSARGEQGDKAASRV